MDDKGDRSDRGDGVTRLIRRQGLQGNGPHRALVGCTGLCSAALDCTGSVLGCKGLYWAVLSCPGLYCVHRAIMESIGFYLTLLGCTRLHWAELDLSGLH